MPPQGPYSSGLLLCCSKAEGRETERREVGGRVGEQVFRRGGPRERGHRLFVGKSGEGGWSLGDEEISAT